jgi:hypothetical protein
MARPNERSFFNEVAQLGAVLRRGSIAAGLLEAEFLRGEIDAHGAVLVEHHLEVSGLAGSRKTGGPGAAAKPRADDDGNDKDERNRSGSHAAHTVW